ncbi:unnamed protein product, partial [Rotaria magnacalcarata]
MRYNNYGKRFISGTSIIYNIQKIDASVNRLGYQGHNYGKRFISGTSIIYNIQKIDASVNRLGYQGHYRRLLNHF